MATMKALSLHITGVVQGVGFRPYIYNLAKELNLAGWVLNASDGVHIVVEGPSSLVDSFPTLVENGAPPASTIENMVLRYVDPVGYDDFEIRESEIHPDARTLISPDMATCPACAKELLTAPTDGTVIRSSTVRTAVPASRLSKIFRMIVR